MAEDTFEFPKHGFTCFHCGETFTTLGSARDHFGGNIMALAGCQIKVGAERGLLMQLRKTEALLAQYVEDNIPLAREMASMQTRHHDALQTAEELGYERGLQQTDDPVPRPCCGEYQTCSRPCTPRGEYIANHRLKG